MQANKVWAGLPPTPHCGLVLHGDITMRRERDSQPPHRAVRTHRSLAHAGQKALHHSRDSPVALSSKETNSLRFDFMTPAGFHRPPVEGAAAGCSLDWAPTLPKCHIAPRVPQRARLLSSAAARRCVTGHPLGAQIGHQPGLKLVPSPWLSVPSLATPPACVPTLAATSVRWRSPHNPPALRPPRHCATKKFGPRTTGETGPNHIQKHSATLPTDPYVRTSDGGWSGGGDGRGRRRRGRIAAAPGTRQHRPTPIHFRRPRRAIHPPCGLAAAQPRRWPSSGRAARVPPAMRGR
eukprot:357252-Chlamydomonas_euryale.AAC.4